MQKVPVICVFIPTELVTPIQAYREIANLSYSLVAEKLS